MRITLLALAAILCCATLLGDASRDAAADGPVSGPPGVIETYAGGGTGGEGSPRLDAHIVPFRLTFSPSGELYFTDWFQTHAVRKISDDAVVRIAGGGAPTSGVGDGGPALESILQRPFGLAFDGGGNLLLADSFNCAIRSVASMSQIISTVAGRPEEECVGQFMEGAPPTESSLLNPMGVALDSDGRLYIADMGYCLVRRSQNNVLTTVAGIPWATSPPGQWPANDARMMAMDRRPLAA